MSITLADLPIGAKVNFGRYKVGKEDLQDIIWVKADQNHEGYPANSVTLITKDIIDLRAFDAMESNNSDANRKEYGNNYYPHSNYRQWLNSDKANWYAAQHCADAPPGNINIEYETGYFIHPGFLYYFTEQEKNAILPTTITVAKNTATDGGGSTTVTDFVFPLSTTEVGLANENNIAEGSKLALFSDDASRIAYLTEQCFNNTKSTNKPSAVSNAWHWWLRTPYSGYSCIVRYVYSSGSLNSNDAFYGYYGVRPALNLSLNTPCYYNEKTNCFYVNVIEESKIECIETFDLSYYGDKCYLIDKAKLLLEIARITNSDECKETCCLEAMKMLIQ